MRRHRLLVFFGLTFAVSWIPGFTYAAFLATGAIANPILLFGLLLATSYGPTLGALLTLALLRDPGEGASFRRRVRTWRVGVRWYLLVLLIPIFIWAVGVSVAALGSGGYVPFHLMAAAAFPAVLIANAGEEIGWRGFAFPHLLERLRPLPASLLFGAIWAALHLPLYLQVLPNFAVLIPMFMALSTIMAWIFLRTGQAILPMVLFHASLDTMQFVMPIAEAPNGTVSFTAIAVVAIAVASAVILQVGRDLGARHAGPARAARETEAPGAG